MHCSVTGEGTRFAGAVGCLCRMCLLKCFMHTWLLGVNLLSLMPCRDSGHWSECLFFKASGREGKTFANTCCLTLFNRNDRELISGLSVCKTSSPQMRYGCVALMFCASPPFSHLPMKMVSLVLGTVGNLHVGQLGGGWVRCAGFVLWLSAHLSWVQCLVASFPVVSAIAFGN